jgi:hypothetical protein
MKMYFMFTPFSKKNYHINCLANSLSFTNARDSVSFEQDLPNHGLSVRCIKFKPAQKNQLGK